MDELQFPRTRGAVLRLTVLAGRELQMPTFDQFSLLAPANTVAVVCFDLQLSFAADVGNVCRDRACPRSPTGHLDHDFRNPSHSP